MVWTTPRFVTRLSRYYRHGFLATGRRAGLAVKRALFASQTVLFYCDLAQLASCPAELAGPLRVEQKTSRSELTAEDLNQMVTVWSPKLVERNIRERFQLGASLWLIRVDGQLAGYGWTLRGTTVEPHYFALGKDDVHFFDFHVFPQFRGRGINPLLVTHILRRLAAGGNNRAFIEAAEWNRAQLISLGKTPFCRLGRAAKWSFLRRTIVCWANPETVQNDGATEACQQTQPLRVKPNVF